MRMGFSAMDGMVVRWSIQQRYRCEWGRVPDEADRGVKVVMRHATIYFRDGTLVRIDCRQDGRYPSEMARELAVVFSLCGYLAAVREDLQTPARRDRLHRTELVIGT